MRDFEYEAPLSLDAAVALLAENGEAARLLAGEGAGLSSAPELLLLDRLRPQELLLLSRGRGGTLSTRPAPAR